MTPYLIKVQDPEIAEDQLCCVLLAEKVHSGYEGNPLNAQKYLKISTNKSLKVRAVLCSATGISLWCSTTEFQPKLYELLSVISSFIKVEDNWFCSLPLLRSCELAGCFPVCS